MENRKKKSGQLVHREATREVDLFSDSRISNDKTRPMSDIFNTHCVN